jgi:hypothetical protein
MERVECQGDSGFHPRAVQRKGNRRLAAKAAQRPGRRMASVLADKLDLKRAMLNSAPLFAPENRSLRTASETRSKAEMSTGFQGQ